MLWSNWAHVPQLPSLRSRARELQLLSQHTATAEACAPQEKPLQREPVHRNQTAAPARHSPQPEKSLHSNGEQHSHKQIQLLKKKRSVSCSKVHIYL